ARLREVEDPERQARARRVVEERVQLPPAGGRALGAVDLVEGVDLRGGARDGGRAGGAAVVADLRARHGEAGDERGVGEGERRERDGVVGGRLDEGAGAGGGALGGGLRAVGALEVDVGEGDVVVAGDPGRDEARGGRGDDLEVAIAGEGARVVGAGGR